MKRMLLCILPFLAVCALSDRADCQANPKDENRYRELEKQLRHPNQEVRTEAARQIREMFYLFHRLSDLLVISLEDRDPLVRAEAARALSVIGPRADGAILPLIRGISKEKEPDALRRMIGALGNIAPYSKYKPHIKESLAAIIPHTKHKDVLVRVQAVASIGAFWEYGMDAVPVLVEAFNDPDPGAPDRGRVCGTAAGALQKIKPRDEKTVATLFKLAYGEEFQRSGYARQTLAVIVPEDERLVPMFSQMLKDKKNPSARAVGARCLMKMGVHARKAAPALVAALRSNDIDDAKLASQVRYQIINALWTIAPQSEEFHQALEKVARSDPDRNVRGHAAHVLERLTRAKCS